MADYSSPIVVRPAIPADALTMLELMVLTEIYEWERDGDGVYFFSEDGTPTEIQLDIEQVRDLVTMAPEERSSIVTLLAGKLAELDIEAGRFDLDVGGLEDARIFQDILHRCPDIDHISIVSGWTCSRMRPDGFGGSVTVVSRDQIQSATTHEMEERLCALADFGDIGCPPGHGEHRVLTLHEPTVHDMLVDIEKVAREQGDPVPSVTDGDLREGCREAIASASLDAYRLNLTFSAAQAAIRIARRRAA